MSDIELDTNATAIMEDSSLIYRAQLLIEPPKVEASSVSSLRGPSL